MTSRPLDFITQTSHFVVSILLAFFTLVFCIFSVPNSYSRPTLVQLPTSAGDLNARDFGKIQEVIQALNNGRLDSDLMEKIQNLPPIREIGRSLLNQLKGQLNTIVKEGTLSPNILPPDLFNLLIINLSLIYKAFDITEFNLLISKNETQVIIDQFPQFSRSLESNFQNAGILNFRILQQNVSKALSLDNPLPSADQDPLDLIRKYKDPQTTESEQRFILLDLIAYPYLEVVNFLINELGEIRKTSPQKLSLYNTLLVVCTELSLTEGTLFEELWNSQLNYIDNKSKLKARNEEFINYRDELRSIINEFNGQEMSNSVIQKENSAFNELTIEQAKQYLVWMSQDITGIKSQIEFDNNFLNEVQNRIRREVHSAANENQSFISISDQPVVAKFPNSANLSQVELERALISIVDRDDIKESIDIANILIEYSSTEVISSIIQRLFIETGGLQHLKPTDEINWNNMELIVEFLQARASAKDINVLILILKRLEEIEKQTNEAISESINRNAAEQDLDPNDLEAQKEALQKFLIQGKAKELVNRLFELLSRYSPKILAGQPIVEIISLFNNNKNPSSLEYHLMAQAYPASSDRVHPSNLKKNGVLTLPFGREAEAVSVLKELLNPNSSGLLIDLDVEEIRELGETIAILTNSQKFLDQNSELTDYFLRTAIVNISPEGLLFMGINGYSLYDLVKDYEYRTNQKVILILENFSKYLAIEDNYQKIKDPKKRFKGAYIDLLISRTGKERIPFILNDSLESLNSIRSNEVNNIHFRSIAPFSVPKLGTKTLAAEIQGTQERPEFTPLAETLFLEFNDQISKEGLILILNNPYSFFDMDIPITSDRIRQKLRLLISRHGNGPIGIIELGKEMSEKWGLPVNPFFASRG